MIPQNNPLYYVNQARYIPQQVYQNLSGYIPQFQVPSFYIPQPHLPDVQIPFIYKQPLTVDEYRRQQENHINIAKTYQQAINPSQAIIGAVTSAITDHFLK